MPEMPNMAAPMQPAAPKSGGAGKVVAIVVVIIIVVGAIAYFLLRSGTGPGTTPPEAMPEQPGQATGDGTQPGETPARPPMPEEVFSYVGEVKSVGNGQISVVVKPDVNYVEAETTLTVRADANTQVIRRTIPKVLPEDGDIAGLFKQENIALSDITAGSQVTVVSATNIKSETDFTASRIEVLNVQ